MKSVPIWKVDGRRYLDSGTIIVTGDAAIEIRVEFGGKPHEVALKFRTTDSRETSVKFGSPKPDRTVVHFVNVPEHPYASGGAHIGKIGDRELILAFYVRPLPITPDGTPRFLAYTLYAYALEPL